MAQPSTDPTRAPDHTHAPGPARAPDPSGVSNAGGRLTSYAEPGASQPVAADLRDHVAFDLDNAVRSRVHETDLLAVDMICLEPGQQLGARTFDDSDVVYSVIGGRAWVVTPASEVTLDPLQTVLMPAGTTHGIRNDSPDPLLLQAVSALPIPLQSLRGTTSNAPDTVPDGRSRRSSPT